jgi:hypothetical protein
MRKQWLNLHSKLPRQYPKMCRIYEEKHEGMRHQGENFPGGKFDRAGSGAEQMVLRLRRQRRQRLKKKEHFKKTKSGTQQIITKPGGAYDMSFGWNVPASQSGFGPPAARPGSSLSISLYQLKIQASILELQSVM